MNNKRSLLPLALAIAVPILVGCLLGYLKWAALHDFALICEVHTNLNAKAPASDPAHAAMETAKTLDEGLRHPEVRKGIEAVAHVDPGSKRAAIEDLAHKMGLKDWQCPALDFTYNPTNSPSTTQ